MTHPWHGFPSPKSQVPHVSKSWHGAKLQLLSLKTLIIIKVGSLFFYTKIFVGLVLNVGARLLLDPTPNTSPKPHLQKAMPCRHPCHNWDLGLGTPCEPALIQCIHINYDINTNYAYKWYNIIDIQLHLYILKKVGQHYITYRCIITIANIRLHDCVTFYI